GHPVPRLLLERLRVRGDVLRTDQPDAADRRLAAGHADVDRLGTADRDRHDRRRADDFRRADRPQVARDRADPRGGDGRMSATTTAENRAAVLHAPGDLRVEERAVPEPGPREVLVEIRSEERRVGKGWRGGRER